MPGDVGRAGGGGGGGGLFGINTTPSGDSAHSG